MAVLVWRTTRGSRVVKKRDLLFGKGSYALLGLVTVSLLHEKEAFGGSGFRVDPEPEKDGEMNGETKVHLVKRQRFSMLLCVCVCVSRKFALQTTAPLPPLYCAIVGAQPLPASKELSPPPPPPPYAITAIILPPALSFPLHLNTQDTSDLYSQPSTAHALSWRKVNGEMGAARFAADLHRLLGRLGRPNQPIGPTALARRRRRSRRRRRRSRLREWAGATMLIVTTKLIR